MSRNRVWMCLLAAFVLAAGGRLAAQDRSPTPLSVTVGKSLVIESPTNMVRVSVGNDNLAEAMAVSPRELVVNAKAQGETSLIVWNQGGHRVVYDITIHPSPARLEAVRAQLASELAGQEIQVEVSGTNVFLRGSVKDVVSAERAEAISATLGKVVNLLHVAVPPVETQILLKVRFADVDRAAVRELGVNLFSTGALGTLGRMSTGQFSPVTLNVEPTQTTWSMSDELNLYLFRPDLNLGATLRALQNRNVLQMLAEPNLLAINGKQASFLAGGEFPFPTLQGGLGQVTISFREFGVRLNFLPRVTPRGTVRLQVMPEVSSLDMAHGLTIQGYTVPALSTRRVQTEVELEDGQSFVIAGLLDNRTTEVFNKMPGIGDIPLLGKLFQSRATNKTDSELLVMVTPEIVRPIPKGQPKPNVEFPEEFLRGTRTPPQTPGIDVTGPVPVKPPSETVPLEQIQPRPSASGSAPVMPTMQLVPVPAAEPQAPTSPGLNPTTPLSSPGGSGK